MKNKKLLVLGLSSVILLTGCDGIINQGSRDSIDSNLPPVTSNSSADSSKVSLSSGEIVSTSTVSYVTVTDKNEAKKLFAAKSKEVYDYVIEFAKTDGGKIGVQVQNEGTGKAKFAPTMEALNQGSGITYDLKLSSDVIANLETIGFDYFAKENPTEEDKNELLNYNTQTYFYSAFAGTVKSNETIVASGETKTHVNLKEGNAYFSSAYTYNGEGDSSKIKYNFGTENSIAAYAVIAKIKSKLADPTSDLYTAIKDIIEDYIVKSGVTSQIQYTQIKNIISLISYNIQGFINGYITSEQLVEILAPVIKEMTNGQLDLAGNPEIMAFLAKVLDGIKEINYDSFFDVTFKDNIFSFALNYENVRTSFNYFFTHLLEYFDGLGEQATFTSLILKSYVTSIASTFNQFSPSDLKLVYNVEFVDYGLVNSKVDFLAKGLVPTETEEVNDDMISTTAYEVSFVLSNKFSYGSSMTSIPYEDFSEYIEQANS